MYVNQGFGPGGQDAPIGVRFRGFAGHGPLGVLAPAVSAEEPAAGLERAVRVRFCEADFVPVLVWSLFAVSELE